MRLVALALVAHLGLLLLPGGGPAVAAKRPCGMSCCRTDRPQATCGLARAAGTPCGLAHQAAAAPSLPALLLPELTRLPLPAFGGGADRRAASRRPADPARELPDPPPRG